MGKSFDDKRSKRVVFVAYCVLNQNARYYDCANFQGMYEAIWEKPGCGENRSAYPLRRLPELTV